MKKNIKFTFLGTGTAMGIPEIGCNCEVCRSDDAKDNRLRSSLWVEYGDLSILIDTSPDLRYQCLRVQIPQVDSVFITHLHADHIFGLDDLRRYNILHRKSIDLYLPYDMEERFRQIYDYTLKPAPKGITVPNLNLDLVDRNPVFFGDLKVTPLPIMHGADEIRGYLFDVPGFRLAYMTDCKEIPEETAELVKDVDVMVLGTIWRNYKNHIKHFDVDEAIEAAQKLGAKKLYLTHFSHFIGKHKDFEKTLNEEFNDWVVPAYDGMRISNLEC